jgi:adenylate kinase family enzyme
MVRLILLRGVPGAGKTTVARAFAAKFSGWDVVQVDDIKIERRGTTLEFHRDDWAESGRRAKLILDAGRNVLLVAFFVNDATSSAWP